MQRFFAQLKQSGRVEASSILHSQSLKLYTRVIPGLLFFPSPYALLWHAYPQVRKSPSSSSTMSLGKAEAATAAAYILLHSSGGHCHIVVYLALPPRTLTFTIFCSLPRTNVPIVAIVESEGECG